MKWSKEKANSWYEEQPWLVGCNFLPSSAINQLEMFQEDTFDEKTIERELDWAKDLGFNSLRVYLHDLLWSEKDKFKKTFDRFLDICEKRRGIQKNINFISEDRAVLEYELPMSEMIYDFYNKVKSITKGYCSMDYEQSELKTSNLVKLDILINGEIVDALSLITHKDNSYYRGKELVEKLKKLIPRQQFEIAIQAAIGAKIISRETVKAFRKDVTAKLYGGDVTRKNKLLDKQKKGKKRMKNVGNVEIPQEAFMAVLSGKE